MEEIPIVDGQGNLKSVKEIEQIQFLNALIRNPDMVDWIASRGETLDEKTADVNIATKEDAAPIYAAEPAYKK